MLFKDDISLFQNVNLFNSIPSSQKKEKDRKKAKVVASASGKEFIQLLATLAVLPRTILNNSMIPSFSFESSWCNASYNSNRPVQRQGIE